MTEWRTVPAESWRDHVEQMLRTWQCRHLNEDGDRLALDDFMGQESIEDVPQPVRDELTFHFVDTIEDVLALGLEPVG